MDTPTPKPTPKLRGRELGLRFEGTPGAHNAITDVGGVEVGLLTRCEATVRTGVTVIFPCGRLAPDRSVAAGQFSFNGNGEMTGSHWIRDAGHFAGPVAITNTHAVGLVHQSLTRWMIGRVPAMLREHCWYMPVVAETYDGATSDINALALTDGDVVAALESARGGLVAEGNVGGGTGMMCYEFKGGTGTSSRQVEVGGSAYTVGVLVQANFGLREDLRILGVPVGRLWPEDAPLSERARRETGSVIVVVATDAPLDALALRRLAKRASFGIARTGSTGGVGSGDLMLAFSTAGHRPWPAGDELISTQPHLSDSATDGLNRATVQACEEAVINAMLAARDMALIKPAGPVFRAIDAARLQELMRRYRALDD